jgi:hypothetical protein
MRFMAAGHVAAIYGTAIAIKSRRLIERFLHALQALVINPLAGGESAVRKDASSINLGRTSRNQTGMGDTRFSFAPPPVFPSSAKRAKVSTLLEISVKEQGAP